MTPFCVQCGELINPRQRRIRIDRFMLHAWCAQSFLVRLLAGMKKEEKP